MWAREWLHSNANLASMQPGWTYMFEAVYQHNTHVVRYPFEMLVLLGAVSPEGAELPDAAARQQLAAQLGVMAVPSIEGALPELLHRLGRGCCTSDEAQDSAAASKGSSNKKAVHSGNQVSGSSSNRSTGNFEGWVAQSEQQRCKLVLQQFQQLSRAASHLLHPLMMWDAVFRGRSRAELAEGLPVHFAAELDGILAALDGQFWAVQKLLDQQLQKAWLSTSALSSVSGSSSKGAVVSSVDVASAPAGEADANAERLSATADDDHPTAASEACSTGATGSAAVLNTPQFADALQYAVDRGTAAVASMFWAPRTASSSNGSSTAPALRGRILECIRPGLDGILPGYTPSPAFKQTYAKGWARGPPAGSRVLGQGPEPLILQQLTDQALTAVLGKLRGRDVGSALRVCRAWCGLVQGDPGLKAAAEKAAAERKGRVVGLGDLARYLCYSYGREYNSYDDSDDDGLYRGYSGYSSP
jgi:hypothetical protein